MNDETRTKTPEGAPSRPQGNIAQETIPISSTGDSYVIKGPPESP